MSAKLVRIALPLGVILSLSIGVYVVRDGLLKGDLGNVILGGLGIAITAIAVVSLIITDKAKGG